MKKYVVMLVVALGIVGFVANKSFAVSFGEEAVNVGNKYCPISGEEIGKGDMEGQTATVEYKGKIYNLCCPMCKDAFLKDPEAAIKKMQEQEAKGK
jgi:YHS domain-containing protein